MLVENNEAQISSLGWYLSEVPRVIKSEFQLINEYIELSEQLFNQRLKDIRKEEIKGELEERFHQTELQKHEEFERTLRNSCFVTIFSLLEEHFRSIVEELPKNKITLNVEDLKGDNIEKPFKFLTQILNCNLDALKSDFDELKKYNELRNKIVHHLGHIDIRPDVGEAQQSRLFKFLKTFPGIDINMEFGRIKIKEKSFLLEFSAKADSFLQKILKALHDEYKKGLWKNLNESIQESLKKIPAKAFEPSQPNPSA